MVRVLYIFAGERRAQIADWKAGKMPDSYLIGFNHMKEFGVDAEFIETDFINKVRKKNFNLAALFLLPKLRNYDIVFGGSSLVLPFIAKYLLRMKRPKFVWYNTFFTHALKRNAGGLKGFAVRKAIASLDGIVCPSTAQRDFLIEQGFDTSRLFLAENGVDVEFLQEKENAAPLLPATHATNGAGAAGPFILSVGKDMGRDYKTLIEALRSLDLQARIVAFSRNMKGIETVPKNITVGAVPFADLIPLYKNASIVVIPTKKDSHFDASDCSGQYALLEAMASGKAIIVSYRATLDDYVKDGQDALFVPAEDPQALRAAIERLQNDEPLRQKLGENAAKKAGSNFTTRLFAQKLAAVFQKVA